MRRILLFASLLALGGCIGSSQPLSWETQQGTRLFGGLRGGAWRVASFGVSAVHLRRSGGPAPATASVRGGALAVRFADGRLLTGEDLAGATLVTSATYYAAGATMMTPALLRLDLVLPHANLYGRAEGEDHGCGVEGDEREYALSISLTRPGEPPNWEPLCAGGQIYSTCPSERIGHLGEAPQRALALPGTWTGGGYEPGADRVTFVCLDGVLAKCQDWGYKAEDDATLHQVCARMARADYHAIEAPRTVDGTPIQIFDARAGRAPLAPGYAFEAGWRLAAPSQPAVVCLTKRRWSTLPLGGFRPDILPDPRRKPIGAGSRFCPEAPLSAADLDELKALGAVLFNNSAFIDAGLYRWKGPAGEQYTTTRYALAGFDPDTGAAESDPPELAAAGWRPAVIDTPADSLPRDRTGFEGGVFRHPVPRPWDLPAGTTPLRTWVLGPPEGPTDYLTTTLANPNADYPDLRGAPPPPRRYARPTGPEGYVFAPPASYPPYPDPPIFRGYRTVPLFTWWDPDKRRHLTTADVAFSHRSCRGVEFCRPGDRHASQDPNDTLVFVRLEGYLLCLGCPL